MTTVKQKTINGMIWNVSERLSLQVILMLISIVLARLLEVNEFGLIGMLAIFTSIAQSLVDSGFGSALIQKKNATLTDSSSIFYFNLLVGILLAGILFFSAPLIANFYHQPELIPVTRVLSLSLVINAFGLVQICMLRRNMDFKGHFIVSMIAVVISGTFGISAALAGLGVWSLVIQTLTNSLAQAVSLWLINKWRPVARFSFASLKTMFSYGSRLLISGLIETVFKNLYQTFIGRTFTATDLGYYSRAATMESAASVATSMSLGQVIFPAFSPYQDDNRTLKQVHSKIIKLSMFLHLPLMIGLIAIAEPLFLFLLTDKWSQSIPYFQLLCIIGLLHPIVVQNYNMFRIKGHTELHLRLEIVKYILTIIAIVFTYRHGILTLIYGQIAVAVITQLLISFVAGRLVDYSLSDLFKSLFPSASLSLIMGIIVYFVGEIDIESNLLTFSLQSVVGITIYYLMNRIIKSPELKEVEEIALNFVKSLIKKIKGLIWKNH
jgi:O-antigen/teichoic acid export membrane protein